MLLKLSKIRQYVFEISDVTVSLEVNLFLSSTICVRSNHTVWRINSIGFQLYGILIVGLRYSFHLKEYSMCISHTDFINSINLP